MKKLVVLSSILVFSLSANAKISIIPASDPQCLSQIPMSLPIIRAPMINIEDGVTVKTLDLAGQQVVLTNSLERWMIEMDIAKDPVISTNQRPLCFGFYNDVRGANASAYKDVAVVFGVRLLATLPAMSEATYAEAIKFILAHEFAHNLQWRHNLKFDYILPMLSTKKKELHADCIAGYLIRAHKEVNLDSASKVRTLIAAIGDPHAVGDHGMAEDRIEAFQRGIESASFDILHQVKLHQVTSERMINYCKKFYPTTN